MEEAKVTHPHGLAGQTDSCYFRELVDYPKDSCSYFLIRDIKTEIVYLLGFWFCKDGKIPLKLSSRNAMSRFEGIDPTCMRLLSAELPFRVHPC